MMIQTICAEGIAQWLSTTHCESLQKYQVSSKKQLENAQNIRTLMTHLEPYMNAFPKGKTAQAIWKKQGEAWFDNWVRQNGFFLMQDMSKEDYDLFFDITRKFLQDVRKFDTSMSIEDAGQAMRNVWIIAILQRIFDKPVGYHKAMFAYSMLYPYSDNYLDDVNVAMEDKKTFNLWFTKRLTDPSIKGRNVHEERISALVQMIEEVFAREMYPDVYKSLLSIQDAQVRSLHQQDGTQQLTTKQLLEISYYKGGTSVVADGYLIDGSLREDQVRFCMQYGFMLQIGDDLQDARYDREHAHQTLVSTCDESLDELFMKLVAYTEDLLQPSVVCSDEALLDYVLKDCLFLLFLAMCDVSEHCSTAILNAIHQCLPMDMKDLKEMQSSMKFSLSQEAIWERIDCMII